MPIPIIIPTGTNYSCSVSGTTFKIVQCELCRGVYVYRMTRTGSGSTSNPFFLFPGGQEVAGMQAHQQLQRKLEEDCDPVPCRHCAHYQENMVAALKRDFQAGAERAANAMVWIAVPLVAFAVASQLLDPEGAGRFGIILGVLGVALAVIGGIMLWVRRSMLSRFEPNEISLEERKEIASEYAKSLDEFRSWLAERGVALELPANVPEPGVDNKSGARPRDPA